MNNNLHISLAAEPIFELGFFKLTNSLLLSIILLGFITAFSFWFDKEARKKDKSALFYMLTGFYQGLLGFFESVAGDKAKHFFPLLASLFTLILLSNWSGLLPGVGSIGIYKAAHGGKSFVPLLRGPTADLNATIAYALIAMFGIQYFGICNLGLKTHLKRYFNFKNPINGFVGILEIFSDLSKVISFSFRLFGNIFAGEVLLTVIGVIFPYLAPLPFLGLEIFVGFIQALVFTMLSLVFISSACSHH